MDGRWIKGKDDWRQDGSGYYAMDGREFKIAVQDLISVKHRVAFLDRVEIARAVKFTTLVKRIRKWCEANPNGGRDGTPTHSPVQGRVRVAE